MRTGPGSHRRGGVVDEVVRDWGAALYCHRRGASGERGTEQRRNDLMIDDNTIWDRMYALDSLKQVGIYDKTRDCEVERYVQYGLKPCEPRVRGEGGGGG